MSHQDSKKPQEDAKPAETITQGKGVDNNGAGQDTAGKSPVKIVAAGGIFGSEIRMEKESKTSFTPFASMKLSAEQFLSAGVRADKEYNRSLNKEGTIALNLRPEIRGGVATDGSHTVPFAGAKGTAQLDLPSYSAVNYNAGKAGEIKLGVFDPAVGMRAVADVSPLGFHPSLSLKAESGFLRAEKAAELFGKCTFNIGRLSPFEPSWNGCGLGVRPTEQGMAFAFRMAEKGKDAVTAGFSKIKDFLFR